MIKTHWEASSTIEDDRSGVGVFEVSGQEYSIRFDDFNDYYCIVKVIDESARLVKEETLKNIKHEIAVMFDIRLNRLLNY